MESIFVCYIYTSSCAIHLDSRLSVSVSSLSLVSLTNVFYFHVLSTVFSNRCFLYGRWARLCLYTHKCQRGQVRLMNLAERCIRTRSIHSSSVCSLGTFMTWSEHGSVFGAVPPSVHRICINICKRGASVLMLVQNINAILFALLHQARNTISTN